MLIIAQSATWRDTRKSWILGPLRKRRNESRDNSKIAPKLLWYGHWNIRPAYHEHSRLNVVISGVSTSNIHDRPVFFFNSSFIQKIFTDMKI